MKSLIKVILACYFVSTVTFADSAKDIVKETNFKGGLIVHLGCGDGELTAALHFNDKCLVHGLDRDPRAVAKARRYIQGLGLYGKVSVDTLDGRDLPYADNMVNLLVAEDAGGVAMKECLRVLAPNGVAYIKSGRRWEKTIKPWPDSIDEWTHHLHDAGGNAVANDSVAGPPAHLQWTAGPVWARSHGWTPSVSAIVSAGGRLFYICDETLTAWTTLCRASGSSSRVMPSAEYCFGSGPYRSGVRKNSAAHTTRARVSPPGVSPCRRMWASV
jgi:SAM-dependent methyltransferase